MTSEARPAAQADVAEDLDTYFEEWREQEAHIDLSDLRPQDAIVFAIFWALFGVVALQFYTRYFMGDSFGWTEEIARFLLIGVTFVGSVTAMRKGTHIAVEVLLQMLPKASRHWVLVTIDGVVALFCAAMAWYGYVLGDRANGYMVSVDIPKSIVYWGVAAALAAMALHAAIRFVRRLTGRESDELHGLALD
jgi:TRAP-type C4-dicarboxylate transport system permease small subunit